MKKPPLAEPARLRLKMLGASALMLLLAACGDHPPKEDDEDEDPPPAPAAIAIVAGDATASGSRDGNGADARFNTPRGIAIDSSGNLYVADEGNSTIRKITPSGTVTTLAGSPGRTTSINGLGANAGFSRPAAIAINRNGILFVADDRRIRTVSQAGQVDTFAEIQVGANVGGRALPLVSAAGIAVSPRDDVYVTNGHGTRRIWPSGAVNMLEGTAVLEGGNGTSPFVPRGVAVDNENNVYVADLERTISKASAAGGLQRFVGSANISGSSNGTGSAASFERVFALTTDPQGNLYAADSGNNLIRKITPAGVVTTVAGTVRSTELKTGALPGSFAELRGIATDGKGTLYATSGNAVVRIRLP